VTEILPALELELQVQGSNNENEHADEFAAMKMTDYGLHDERFVAHTILPAIRELNYNINNNNNDQRSIEIRVDREMYFVRVRADGSIWLRDKPGFGRVKKSILERALGRKCTGEPYEVPDDTLHEKSPGRWQIKCPPSDVIIATATAASSTLP